MPRWPSRPRAVGQRHGDRVVGGEGDVERERRCADGAARGEQGRRRRERSRHNDAANEAFRPHARSVAPGLKAQLRPADTRRMNGFDGFERRSGADRRRSAEKRNGLAVLMGGCSECDRIAPSHVGDAGRGLGDHRRRPRSRAHHLPGAFRAGRAAATTFPTTSSSPKTAVAARGSRARESLGRAMVIRVPCRETCGVETGARRPFHDLRLRFVDSCSTSSTALAPGRPGQERASSRPDWAREEARDSQASSTRPWATQAFSSSEPVKGAPSASARASTSSADAPASRPAYR